MTDWSFSTFGHPTFLNYGRNYDCARDEYVYTVFHYRPSAYRASDGFALLPAPIGRLRILSSYEFFSALDSHGCPIRASESAQRGEAFSFPSHCRRSGITFNTPLERYLWWQRHTFTRRELRFDDPDADTRYQGGFGVYDPPEPWGPWSGMCFTESWDVGPGETACFPTKWISWDGHTIFLVFSGSDAFSIRRATVCLLDLEPRVKASSQPVFKV